MLTRSISKLTVKSYPPYLVVSWFWLALGKSITSTAHSIQRVNVSAKLAATFYRTDDTATDVETLSNKMCVSCTYHLSLSNSASRVGSYLCNSTNDFTSVTVFHFEFSPMTPAQCGRRVSRMWRGTYSAYLNLLFSLLQPREISQTSTTRW